MIFEFKNSLYLEKFTIHYIISKFSHFTRNNIEHYLLIKWYRNNYYYKVTIRKDTYDLLRAYTIIFVINSYYSKNFKL